jgi:hypothetical protein
MDHLRADLKAIAMCCKEALLDMLDEMETEHAWPRDRAVEAVRSAWRWT